MIGTHIKSALTVLIDEREFAILRCPLIPDAIPKLTSMGAFWQVEVSSPSGLWVEGPAWMDKQRAVDEWNDLMTNYPGAKP